MPDATQGNPKPRYCVAIDDHPMVAVAPDEESQRALWLLIEKRLGIQRIAAENLLDTGKMLFVENFFAVREDVLDLLVYP